MALCNAFCTLNKLIVNTTKTKIVVFRKGAFNKYKDFEFYFNGSRIEMVDEFTYLGVLFSDHEFFEK